MGDQAVKLLIHSNTPNAPTGYGMQCGMLCERLMAAGHEVAVSSTWGQQGEITNWRGVRIYPSGWAEQSADVLHLHALHWFGSDPRAGWIITLLDTWALKSPLLHEFNVAAWVPVDHDPVPPPVLDWLRRSGARPVAMSKFGERALRDAGLDSVYIPLAVDTSVYRPTMMVDAPSGPVDARTFFDLPHGAFVVGMVAMNKDPQDRKGFNEAFRAFGRFRAVHPEARMVIHSETYGIMGGIDLRDVLRLADVPEDAVTFTDQYALRLGFPRGLMAALYTSMDVLLAPSKGEGFCVPLIEAQACGVPVIVSDFTSQPELVGAGHVVGGQVEYDPPMKSCYFRASVDGIVSALEETYRAQLRPGAAAMWDLSQEFAAGYDADTVFREHWAPFLASLEPAPAIKPVMDRVDVIVPLARPQHRARLEESFAATADDRASLHLWNGDGSYAEKVNAAIAASDADWVCVVGDDCEFAPGWLAAARAVSDRWDVIGTNDSEAGRVRNPDVAAGRHADHFFVRRSYVDEQGACLDGPGVAMPTAYHHWWVDREVIQLARARGVYGHCHESRIIHHHPGFDGREDLRRADPVYMEAVAHAEADRATFLRRAPLIENHRVLTR